MTAATSIPTIVAIEVEQAEGDVDRLVKGKVTTVEAANALLYRIAANGPDMGYYKTDVTVTWSDDVSVKMRFDVMIQGTENNDTDVTRHLRGFAKFILKTARSYGQPEGAIKLANEILDEKRAVL